MATTPKFAAGEVLVLATEDDCSGRSNSENREGIDGAIHAYRGMTIIFSSEGLEDVGAVMGEAIPDQDLVTSLPKVIIIGLLRMNYTEEDRLGKQSFVPKAILHC